MEPTSFKKVLVATDYTQLSENAVNTAAAMSQKQNATLILLHVVESAVPFDEHHFEFDYSKEMKHFAESQLKTLADNLRKDYQINVKELITYGDVVREIIRAVKENSPDLVMVGTHGTSGFRRFFIGSTAYRVIKHTTYPVMTIPGEGSWTRFQNILFPIRVVPGALKKYDTIRPIIQKNNSTLYILGLTLDSGVDKMGEVIELEHELEERLRRDEVRFEITYDHCHHYADAILSMAKEKKADLIVITATLEVAFREFFIGPFAQQVINHAKVPVICIRSQ